CLVGSEMCIRDRWYMAQDRTAWWNKFSFPATRPIYSSGLDTWWYDVNKAATLPADRR
ncbi:hypothetical protein QLF84_24845, partial [Salmonella enterica subsp. enterica serovar Oslo]|uniref:hypothetical protein n=1 Tax=Salmonella enterica TaxID=28901 RepID=UPI00288D894D